MHGPAGRVKVEHIGHAIPFIPNVLFLYPLKTSEKQTKRKADKNGIVSIVSAYISS